MQLKVKRIEALPEIIAESVKPIGNIHGIKILQVDGLGGGTHANGAESANGGGSLADQIVNSALKYRTQAPLLDAMMREIGLDGGDLNGMAQALGASGEAKPQGAKTRTGRRGRPQARTADD